MNHNEFWWRFFPEKELTQVYLSTAIRSFAISLLGIFIPLYLYLELNFSFEQTISFFIFYSVIFAVATPLAAKFSATYGVKHSVLVSVPFYLAFVALLYLLPYFNIPLLLISALMGMSQAFYWLGMHLVFHHVSDHDHRGEEVGARTSMTVISGMIGPFLGGLLITFFGFKALFLLTAILLFLSALVLFKSKEGRVRYHFSFKSVLNRDHWKDSLFFVSRGTAVIANGVIWPLFVFVILGSYTSLGLTGSLFAGLSAILLWVIGKYSDHSDKRKIIRLTTIFDSAVWVLRAFVVTVPHVFAVTALAALTTGTREAPLGALEYDKARGEIAAYFVSREVFICLGRILLLTVVLLFGNLSSGLLFQAIANLAVFLF